MGRFSVRDFVEVIITTNFLALFPYHMQTEGAIARHTLAYGIHNLSLASFGELVAFHA